jgi:cbb3-type cytochrome oxidase cytochrome c subunit
MTHRFLLPALVLFSLLPVARAVEPAELKPGLVAVYTDPQKGPPPPGVTRLEPTVALTLNAGESPHPRLKGLGSARWTGYVNVVRGGKYTFSATALGGTLTVQVGGKPVFAATAGDREPVTKSGSEVVLEGGVQPFEATFAAPGGAARVELFWEGPGFRKEPVAHQFLGHLPADRPASFITDAQLEHGRFKFEELACARCHKPATTDQMAKGLADRPGPNLTDVAKRSYAGWIDAWLADPAKLRPHTVMPKMFAADDAGKAERYAVTKYLVSLAGKPLEPVKAPTLDNSYRQSMEKGRVLFTVSGCAACHTEPQPKKKAAPADEDEKPPLRPEDYVYGAGTAAGPASKYALGALGSKYTPVALAAFLQDPLKVNPAGRMPHMTLSGVEAQDLARYLCRVTDETFEPAMPPVPKGLKPALIAAPVYKAFGAKPADVTAFEKLAADTQWIDLGRKLLVTKGCVNCHAVEPGGKALAPAAAFPTLADVKKAGHGCLAPKPAAGTVPAYKLDATETAAIAAFLKDGLTGAGSPAPTHAARLALRRFNCLNCHSKDGEGGIPVELSDQMRLLEKAENADDVRPPLLTGIGHKSRTPWLKAVLTQAGRARPWMQLRMPQYGEKNVGALPEALAALEGTVPDDAVRKLPLTATAIGTGRSIIGKGGLGCISCHDIAGVPNSGTRGPDLATINQRVRYDWYERWLHQPLRMAPGTKMPQAFVDGKSTLNTVLNGDAKAQAEAMWAYLSLGPGLPLPDGMEPPKGLIVAVKERPEVLRTFMAEAGTKAIAVGYPGGVSVAFSADQCRLSYAWAGNFLDASPVWNNRGGAPAKLLGPKFWTAPPGHPWGLTANPQLAPDFLARAAHPAFGTPFSLEPARIYTGPRAVQFDGFALDADGRPTFRYALTEGKGAVLKVAETPLPLKTGIAAGLARRFAVEAPAGFQTWLFAGSSTKEPRVLSADEQAVAIDLTAAEATVAVAGNRVVLPGDGDKATVLQLLDAPAGTEWRLLPRTGGGWLAVVRLPGVKGPKPLEAAFTLAAWGLPKDDDGLLKGLAAK